MTLIWINYSCAQRTIRTPTSFALWRTLFNLSWRSCALSFSYVVCMLNVSDNKPSREGERPTFNTFVSSDFLSVECCVVGLVYIAPCFYPFIWREYINIIAAVYCGFHVLLCPGFRWVYLCAHKCEIPCQSPLGCYVNICLVQDRAQGRITVDSE